MAINDISAIGIGYGFQTPAVTAQSISNFNADNYQTPAVSSSAAVENGVETVSSTTDQSTNVVTNTQNLIASLITYNASGQVVNTSRNVTGTVVNIVG